MPPGTTSNTSRATFRHSGKAIRRDGCFREYSGLMPNLPTFSFVHIGSVQIDL